MTSDNNEPATGPNLEYLKEWSRYQRDWRCEIPILLPISVNMNNGIIDRHVIQYDKIADMRSHFLTWFEDHCRNPNGYLEDKYETAQFERMLDEYIAFFDPTKGGPKKNLIAPGPLDLKINRPIWLLFHLPRPEWKFSEDRQYSTENDRDDFARNFEKIMTFDDHDWLLLANHCRSSPKGLKYNLHVTITQPEGETPIIIDPGSENDPRGGTDEDSVGLP